MLTHLVSPLLLVKIILCLPPYACQENFCIPRYAYASVRLVVVWPKETREYFAKFGKQGGKKRARNMTPEERRESARRAAQARWAKKKKAAKQK